MKFCQRTDKRGLNNKLQPSLRDLNSFRPFLSLERLGYSQISLRKMAHHPHPECGRTVTEIVQTPNPALKRLANITCPSGINFGMDSFSNVCDLSSTSTKP